MLKMSNPGTSSDKLEQYRKSQFEKIEKEREKNGEFETVGEFSLGELENKVAHIKEEIKEEVKKEIRDDIEYEEADNVMLSTSTRDTLANKPYSNMALTRMIFKTEEYNPGDIGNAQRFYELFGDKYRYVPAKDCWYYYNDKFWEMCENDEAMTAMMITIKDAMQDEIELAKVLTRGTPEKSPQRFHLTALKKHYIASSASKKIASALKIAELMPEFKFKFENFDSMQSAYLFNCASGTINLKDGSIKPHSIDDNITKASKIELADTADCPMFTKLMNDITLEDRELVKYMQKMFGAAMIGERKKSQEFYLFLGVDGSNGKSTLMNIMSNIFGSYLVNSSAYTWIKKKDNNSASASPDVAKLAGARLVFAAELPKGEEFNENLIKSYTGGDVISTRGLYEKTFEFRPNGTLMLSSNHKPRIDAGDNSMWRRNKAIPFLAKFSGKTDNQNLEEEMVSEYPQILKWVLDGCLAYQRESMKELPESVKKCLQAYKDSLDTVDQFIKATCVISSSDKDYTATGTLFEAYLKWNAAQGHKHNMIRKNFVESLKRLGLHEGEKTKFQNRSVVLNVTIGNLDF